MDTTLSFSLHCHQATLPSGNPALAWMPLIHPLYWWIPPMESPSIIVVEESCAIPWNEDDFHDETSLISLNARCSSIFRNRIQYEITVLSGKKSTQNPWIHHSHMCNPKRSWFPSWFPTHPAAGFPSRSHTASDHRGAGDADRGQKPTAAWGKWDLVWERMGKLHIQKWGPIGTITSWYMSIELESYSRILANFRIGTLKSEIW